MIQLPLYKINNKFYFLDMKLNEYRNVKNPFDVLNYNDVGLNQLQIATFKDIRYLIKIGVMQK